MVFRCYQPTRPHPHRLRLAGLILPATLAHLGLPQLVDRHLDLGRAPGRANDDDHAMVASALAGGDCIDDADVLRTAGQPAQCGQGPSTLFSFDVTSRVAGHGLRTRRRTIHHRPGRRLRPTGPRRVPATTANRRITRQRDVLILREGRANTARDFLKRWGGFDSLCGPTAASIPTPWSPSAPDGCPLLHHHHSHRTRRLDGFLTGWTVPLLWPRPLPTPHRCGSSSGGCSPRAPNWLSSPPTAIRLITDRDGETLELEATSNPSYGSTLVPLPVPGTWNPFSSPPAAVLRPGRIRPPKETFSITVMTGEEPAPCSDTWAGIHPPFPCPHGAAG